MLSKETILKIIRNCKENVADIVEQCMDIEQQLYENHKNWEATKRQFDLANIEFNRKRKELQNSCTHPVKTTNVGTSYDRASSTCDVCGAEL